VDEPKAAWAAAPAAAAAIDAGDAPTAFAALTAEATAVGHWVNAALGTEVVGGPGVVVANVAAAAA
jgi:hypothetical protein